MRLFRNQYLSMNKFRIYWFDHQDKEQSSFIEALDLDQAIANALNYVYNNKLGYLFNVIQLK